MSDNSLSESGNDELSEGEFDDFLSELDEQEQNKSQTLKEQLRTLYENWAKDYNMIHNQFKTLWSTLGQVQDRVEGWHRTQFNDGKNQYGPTTFTKNNRFFHEVSLYYNGQPTKSPVPSAYEKMLLITYAGDGQVQSNYPGRSPVHDERILENYILRSPEDGPELEGLDAYLDDDTSKSRVERLIDKVSNMHDELNDATILFEIHVQGDGYQEHRSITERGVRFLEDNKLSNLGKQLFVKLSKQDIVVPEKELPAGRKRQ